MADIKFSFIIEKTPINIISRKNNVVTLESNSSENSLAFSVWYDYSEKPLKLISNIKIGDTVSIISFVYVL